MHLERLYAPELHSEFQKNIFSRFENIEDLRVANYIFCWVYERLVLFNPLENNIRYTWNFIMIFQTLKGNIDTLLMSF